MQEFSFLLVVNLSLVRKFLRVIFANLTCVNNRSFKLSALGQGANLDSGQPQPIQYVVRVLVLHIQNQGLECYWNPT